MKIVKLKDIPKPAQRDIIDYVLANPRRFDGVETSLEDGWGLKDVIDAYLRAQSGRIAASPVDHAGIILSIVRAAKEEVKVEHVYDSGKLHYLVVNGTRGEGSLYETPATHPDGYMAFTDYYGGYSEDYTGVDRIPEGGAVFRIEKVAHTDRHTVPETWEQDFKNTDPDLVMDDYGKPVPRSEWKTQFSHREEAGPGISPWKLGLDEHFRECNKKFLEETPIAQQLVDWWELHKHDDEGGPVKNPTVQEGD